MSTDLKNTLTGSLYYPFLQRWVRGILADVWVSEESSSLGGYQTTELFFSRHDWNIFIEEVNAHQELPVGIATYWAPQVLEKIRFALNVFFLTWPPNDSRFKIKT